MTDGAVNLEKVSAFARMLKREGLPVSLRETEDACRILITLGMEDRQQVKTALRTVFAKSREEQLAFDRVFDGFFLSEEAIREQAKRQMEKEREMAEKQVQAQEDLQMNGTPMDLTEEQKKTYATLPEENKQKLRNFMDKYKDSATRNPN